MIITEYFMSRSDGVVLNRTYSDQGMMIERDGVRYSEAVDPADLVRVYIETDEPVESPEGRKQDCSVRRQYAESNSNFRAVHSHGGQYLHAAAVPDGL